MAPVPPCQGRVALAFLGRGCLAATKVGTGATPAAVGSTTEVPAGGSGCLRLRTGSRPSASARAALVLQTRPLGLV